jgi:hypothetical protein
MQEPRRVDDAAAKAVRARAGRSVETLRNFEQCFPPQLRLDGILRPKVVKLRSKADSGHIEA